MERMPPDGQLRVFYFADVMPAAAATRLTAAIVWRLAPDDAHGGARRWGRGPVGWLRRLRHRLWMRLGPLGIDVEWPGTDPEISRRRVVRSVGLSGDDEPRVYYDGRTVRVLGRVYELPTDERSLVLLVDEGGRRVGRGRRRAAPRVTARTLLAPLAPAPQPPPPDPSLDELLPGYEGIDFRTDVVAGGGQPEWETALRADPEVRAFMDADPST